MLYFRFNKRGSRFGSLTMGGQPQTVRYGLSALYVSGPTRVDSEGWGLLTSGPSHALVQVVVAAYVSIQQHHVGDRTDFDPHVLGELKA